MKVLALEFSSTQRSVAIVQRETGALSEVVETGAQSTNVLGMIEEALRAAGLEREQIDLVAVGLGPGSYTGIRSAIALAQGWQLARGVKLIGLSSAEAIATEASQAGLTGTAEIVIDAQRNEFYLAGYELAPSRPPREVSPLRLATRAEVEARQRVGSVLVGPEVTQWFPGARQLFPRASTLGAMGLGCTDFVAGENLKPIYLRETTFVKAPPRRKLE